MITEIVHGFVGRICSPHGSNRIERFILKKLKFGKISIIHTSSKREERNLQISPLSQGMLVPDLYLMRLGSALPTV